MPYVLLCKGDNPQKFGYAIYFEIGENWGGVNFGGFFFVQKKASTQLKRHEYGHSFQNMMLGLFMPLLWLISHLLFDTIIETTKRQKGIPYSLMIVFGVKAGQQS